MNDQQAAKRFKDAPAWLKNPENHGARVDPLEDEFLYRHPDPSAVPNAGPLAAERRVAVRGAVVSLPQRERTLLFTEPTPRLLPRESPTSPPRGERR